MAFQGPTREAVFQALYNLLFRNVTGVQNYSRRFTMPQKLGAQDLAPGTATLMLWEQAEHTKQDGPTPPRIRTWEAWIVVYFRNTDKSVAGATILNPIIDSIESLLNEVGGTPVQNLGGLVQGVWIAGETHIETGDTDDNGLGGAIVPIHILVP